MIRHRNISVIISVLLLVGSLSAETLVDVNTASDVELISVMGIGKATARAIISERPIGTIEELLGCFQQKQD